MIDLTNILDAATGYSNVVLLSVLPHVSDFAQRLNLPIEKPLSQASVRIFKQNSEKSDPGGMLLMTNGMQFWYRHGYAFGFRSPRSYYSEQNPAMVPKYYGRLNLTTNDAIQLVHTSMAKLGIEPDLLFLDLPPEIEGPETVGENTVPFYELSWRDPRSGQKGLIVEVDGQKGSIESMWLLSPLLWKDGPNHDGILRSGDPDSATGTGD